MFFVSYLGWMGLSFFLSWTVLSWCSRTVTISSIGRRWIIELYLAARLKPWYLIWNRLYCRLSSIMKIMETKHKIRSNCEKWINGNTEDCNNLKCWTKLKSGHLKTQFYLKNLTTSLTNRLNFTEEIVNCQKLSSCGTVIKRFFKNLYANKNVR